MLRRLTPEGPVSTKRPTMYLNHVAVEGASITTLELRRGYMGRCKHETPLISYESHRWQFLPKRAAVRSRNQ
jgi:hypothetical protein